MKKQNKKLAKKPRNLCWKITCGACAVIIAGVAACSIAFGILHPDETKAIITGANVYTQADIDAAVKKGYADGYDAGITGEKTIEEKPSNNTPSENANSFKSTVINENDVIDKLYFNTSYDFDNMPDCYICFELKNTDDDSEIYFTIAKISDAELAADMGVTVGTIIIGVNDDDIIYINCVIPDLNNEVGISPLIGKDGIVKLDLSNSKLVWDEGKPSKEEIAIFNALFSSTAFGSFAPAA